MSFREQIQKPHGVVDDLLLRSLWEYQHHVADPTAVNSEASREAVRNEWSRIIQNIRNDDEDMHIPVRDAIFPSMNTLRSSGFLRGRRTSS